MPSPDTLILAVCVPPLAPHHGPAWLDLLGVIPWPHAPTRETYSLNGLQEGADPGKGNLHRMVREGLRESPHGHVTYGRMSPPGPSHYGLKHRTDKLEFN